MNDGIRVITNGLTSPPYPMAICLGPKVLALNAPGKKVNGSLCFVIPTATVARGTSVGNS